jgi:hypothetical protein
MKTASSAEFNKAALQTYTVAGHSAGLFKTAGNVSYVRIAEAGHEVPAYKVRFTFSIVFAESLCVFVVSIEHGPRVRAGGVPVLHADDGEPVFVLDIGRVWVWA